MSPATTARAKSRRRADVPAEVRRALDSGEKASENLVEWLVLDQQRLLARVLEQTDWPGEREALLKRAKPFARKGIVQRVSGIGRLLQESSASLPLRERMRVRKAVLAHRSDMVRSWGAFMLATEPGLALPELIARLTPLADDAHFGVREIAWLALRPHVAQDVDRAIRLLLPWTRHRSENLRRFASEVTRPRGVWCGHIAELKKDPGRASVLLERLRADDSRYVQNSVGNWLNDASKSRPDWVRELARQWLDESDCKQTKYIVKRALRSLKGTRARSAKA